MTKMRLTFKFFRLSESFSTLDFLVSLSEFSSLPNHVRPSFGASLRVRGGRHPILEHLRDDVVANDVEAVAKDANLHLLTGSNAAGKSTYLKQIVLLQILAQTGAFVPAAEVRGCPEMTSLL